MTRRDDDVRNPYERTDALTRTEFLKVAAGTAASFSVLGLAGCGGGDEPAGQEAAGPVRRGGILQVAISDTGGAKENLDPAVQTNLNDGLYTDLLYDGLTASDE